MRRPSLPARVDAMSALVALASLLVVVALLGSGLRPLLVVGVPVVAAGVVFHRLPRGIAAVIALLLGVVSLGAGLIAGAALPVGAGALYLIAGVRRGWGVNRGKRRRRAWANRALAAVGTVLALFLVVYPTLLAVDYLAKPRRPIDEASLGLAHRQVSFTASDGVRLSGWYVPGRNHAAVVVVHGGGGDRQGTVRHARMLAAAGYGVLLYDARGRGRSAGHENAFGWRWDRDVHGAVDFLQRQGIDRIGLLGISTGAEVVVTEAAADPRVRAVVADGLQGRTPSDASVLPFGDRISLEPPFAVLAAELQLVRGERPPPPLMDLVHRVAAARPLLLVGTVSFEREFDRAYTRGTAARLWELPASAHTEGLKDEPSRYPRRVLSVFDGALR